MLDLKTRVFLNETRYHCKRALRLLGMIDQILVLARTTPHEELEEDVTTLAHYVLIHAGAVAKLLWPVHAGHATRAATSERGRRRRDLLGADAVAALKDRRLRHDLDHPATALDAWEVAEDEMQLVCHASLGEPEAVRTACGDLPVEVLRGYDPAGMTFEFMGAYFDIAALARDLQTIGECAARLLDAPAAERTT
jgi:hypothetical protein